jgi:uncharacterized protein YjeT (DUF2065 family)
MLNLDFWYMFLGFLLVIATVPAVISPKFLKKILKQIFKDENHLRTVGLWYLTAGPLAVYSGWGAGLSFAANLLLVIGVLFSVQGLLLFFATDWYQSVILKKVLHTSDIWFQVFGSIKFITGLLFIYFGFIFV